MSEEKTFPKQKLLTGIGIALCVLLIPILAINCILLIKGWTNGEEVPSIGGVAPMIVLTDSMNGTFNGGDLIFVKKVDAKDVKAGDVISFFDPDGNGTSVTSHRVVQVLEEDGELFFRTKGDNNNANDRLPVSADKLVGQYTGVRIPGAGNVAMFMQSTWGLLFCVAAPIALLVGWDALRRSRYNKQHQQDKDALLTELEELRKLKAMQDAAQTEQAAEE